MSKKNTPAPKKEKEAQVVVPQPVADIVIPPAHNPVTNLKFKRAFYISLLVMLGIIWVAGYNVGYCSDEMDMAQYGKANISYYKSGGKDTGFLNLHQDGDSINAMKTLPYYGSNFEYIATGINYITGQVNGKNEFNIRHIINQFLAIVAILFTGLCAVRIRGYRAALFVSWLLFLTPYFFGWSLFDTKDIPFCTGYIASVYFLICFLEQLPTPTWRTTLYLMLSFTFAIGIRVGGMLLFMYLFLFIALYLVSQKELRNGVFSKAGSTRLFMQLAAIVLGTLILVVICWPFVLRAPLAGLLESYGAAKKFPASIPMNFNGERIRSIQLPQNYLLTYLFITIPVFILVSIGASIIFLSVSYKTIKWRPTFIVFFSGAFPLVFAIVTGVFLYNGWRHLMFLYPGFVVIAGLGLDLVMERLRKPVFQLAFAGVCMAAMLHPVIWSIKNNPYEYVYYNETKGFKNAYADYENDVWSISVKPSIDWLIKNEKILESKDSFLLISNAATFVKYYVKTNYPSAKLKIEAVGANNYRVKKFDYFVFNTLFLTSDYIQNYYPPEGVIHAENVDGLPVTVVIKDTLHLQYECWKASHKDADSLVNLYLTTTKKFNPYMNGSIAMVRAMNGNYDEALSYGLKSVQYDHDDILGHAALSFVYYKRKNLDGAIEHIKECLSMAPNDEFILQLADSIEAQIHK